MGPTGTYIETCNKVLMGYFGNLEVVSKTGMKRFLEQFEGYYVNGGKCWRWDTPDCKSAWKYGPWGEDLFMQRNKDDTDFVPSCDGAYKFVAVHPFRNITAWQTCY